MGFDLFVNCILKMISSFNQMLLWICCPEMSKHRYGWERVGSPDQDTLSVPVAILPAAFLTHDHFSSLIMCWLMWTFNSWYFSHSMARFSFSIQIQCSMMLLPCLFLLKMHSFYYTALYLPQMLWYCFNNCLFGFFKLAP